MQPTWHFLQHNEYQLSIIVFVKLQKLDTENVSNDNIFHLISYKSMITSTSSFMLYLDTAQDQGLWKIFMYVILKKSKVTWKNTGQNIFT